MNLTRVDLSALTKHKRIVVRLLQFVAALWDQFNRDKVVIRSGLAPGDKVCISPLETVVDGMRVRDASAVRGPGETEE